MRAHRIVAAVLDPGRVPVRPRAREIGRVALADRMDVHPVGSRREAARDEFDAQPGGIAVDVGAAAVGALIVIKLGIGVGGRQRRRRLLAHPGAAGERERPEDHGPLRHDKFAVRTHRHLAAPFDPDWNQNVVTARCDPGSPVMPAIAASSKGISLLWGGKRTFRCSRHKHQGESAETAC